VGRGGNALTGQMRMLWWRETVGDMYGAKGKQQAPKHPVAQALHRGQLSSVKPCQSLSVSSQSLVRLLLSESLMIGCCGGDMYGAKGKQQAPKHPVVQALHRGQLSSILVSLLSVAQVAVSSLCSVLARVLHQSWSGGGQPVAQALHRGRYCGQFLSMRHVSGLTVCDQSLLSPLPERPAKD
jgi:hypothetical protein